MNEPAWDEIPTDEELLLARAVLQRLSRALPVGGYEPWGSIVEARRQLTVAIDYLAGWPGHRRRFRRLWNRMLEQDR